MSWSDPNVTNINVEYVDVPRHILKDYEFDGLTMTEARIMVTEGTEITDELIRETLDACKNAKRIDAVD